MANIRTTPLTSLRYFQAVIIILLLNAQSNRGLEDLYSNSYISPHSAKDDQPVEYSEETGGSTSAPEILSTIRREDESKRVVRSADPIIVRNYDDLSHYKNLAEAIESNDVDMMRGAKFIQPSRTLKEPGLVSFTQMRNKLSGEGFGAPQARQLLEPHHIEPSATRPANIATASNPPPPSTIFKNRPRQSNPDIQDIITGIVKLLNGNVNVQANTSPSNGARPLRPLSTRINNRGPPRITDLPALPPDFDVPSQPLPPAHMNHQKLPPPPVTNIPMRMPTPYPFDLPPPPPGPGNTSPIRPMMGLQSTKRPGLYRPVTIPPWSRPPPPYRRPIPGRRPTPIPPYQPKPEETISITSERPDQGEDILTLDLGSQMISSFEDQQNHNHHEDKEQVIKDTDNEALSSPIPIDTTTLQDINNKNVKDISEVDKDFEKHKEKSSSKMEKHSLTHSSSISTELQSSTSIETYTDFDSLSTSTSSIINDETTTTIEPSSVLSNDVFSTEASMDNILKYNATNNHSELGTLQSSFEETATKEIAVISGVPTEELPTSIIGSTASPIISLQTTSTQNFTSHVNTILNESTASGNAENQSFPYYPYRPRPGIVLDDTEYKPGGVNRPPILTARPPIGQLGEIFDVTVSAIQGPGGSSGNGGSGHGKPYVIPVDIENIHGRPVHHHHHHHGHGHADVITSPVGDEGFVSIDGKRTYLNLFGEQTPTQIAPTATVSKTPIKATGYAEVEKTKVDGPNGLKPTPRRPLYGGKRPTQPPVRIDTCIVGDDSTCDASQYEFCMTEAGVSSCHCRPGHARRKHREPCRKVVSLLISLRVDRLYDHRVAWSNEFVNRNGDLYQQLSFEAERALDSAMSMTPFSDEFLGAKVNNIYEGNRSQGQAGVFVNLTLQVEENAETSRINVKGDIQRHLLGVIQRRSNNIGNSALWVDSPPGSVSNLQDMDECSSNELNDCHILAHCINTFGGFKCTCNEGYRDPWSDNKHRAGRQCEQCSSQHCNNRGECKYEHGQEVCICTGNYYGNQCELDGEVLGVAIGASVAAVIIIGLTLVCLVMWSRRWNREQKAAMGSPVFGYMATASNSVKTPAVGGPPYQMTLEDRLRWAQIADAMAQTNHYAPEPVTATRPSSAMFGYPSLSMAGTLPHGGGGGMHGTLPPIPLPRLSIPATLAGRAASVHGMRPLDNSSSSEEEDKADLLGRNFHVPRPKSRSNASIANQSGIYYDVDYEQNEIYKHPSGNIPMSTYTAGRHPFYRN